MKNNLLKSMAVSFALSLLFIMANNTLHANEIKESGCDKNILNKMLTRAFSNGASIVKESVSSKLEGYCEVVLKLNNNFEILYANTTKNHFLASAILVEYDENSKDYVPNRDVINEFVVLQEQEKNQATIAYLKDLKVLGEYYDFAVADKSLKKDRKYDVLLFESKSCGYCNELKQKLSNKYKTEDVGIYRIELPLSINDYNDLKDNYYKNEEKLKKAIALKDKLLDGVPLVLIRDAETKEFVDIFRSPNSQNFERFINYLEKKNK
jgi:hypothetical protein